MSRSRLPTAFLAERWHNIPRLASKGPTTYSGVVGQSRGATRPSPATATATDLPDHIEGIVTSLAAGRSDVLDVATAALSEYPTEPALLQLAAQAALFLERPERALRYVKRLEKRWAPNRADRLIKALALAQQERWVPARHLLHECRLVQPELAPTLLRCPNPGFSRRIVKSVRNVLERGATHASSEGRDAPRAVRSRAPEPRPSPPRPAGHPGEPDHPGEPEDARYALSRAAPTLAVRFKLPSAADLAAHSDHSAMGDPEWFGIRRELTEFGLARGFDELLCLPTLRSVETYWYQIETVRKVLKQFRGRVLLADEVGLGKTIEAGMLVKEYLLRGMARSVLVLTPASLVGQWREELLTKFDLEFATTQDPRLKTDPEALWAEPLLVASIASARRTPHAALLAKRAFDVVVVDEAHHLKNRRTRGYALVNGLRKRFLILLSATPVQNNLLELYNLLTLLKPGIFKTEKDFRTAYMTPGKPRVPANQSEMRDLMRDVMIRNTRALVDVRLPPRHVTTLRPEPTPEEAAAYRALADRVRTLAKEAPGRSRLALRHLLTAAGSSPHAAAAALARFLAKRKGSEVPGFAELTTRYAGIERGAKEQALLDLLARNPGERAMVFSHHLATIERLADLLREQKLPFARFDGSMSGPDKDAAIERFRNTVPILLSTETGGEGRNVQFANTLVNFDLPWNPMTLEQRIGRVHRIGQARDVFIFNLATRNTLEDHLLRVLDDKINMFELVIGEIGDILGEIDSERDFAEAVFTAWVDGTEAHRGDCEAREDGVFGELERSMLRARQRHAGAKALDDALFGDEFEAV